MKACVCGSRRFDISAVYSACDKIELDDDNEGFDLIDTTYGDGEWEDHSEVTCAECGKSFEYKDWDNQEE